MNLLIWEWRYTFGTNRNKASKWLLVFIWYKIRKNENFKEIYRFSISIHILIFYLSKKCKIIAYWIISYLEMRIGISKKKEKFEKESSIYFFFSPFFLKRKVFFRSSHIQFEVCHVSFKKRNFSYVYSTCLSYAKSISIEYDSF